MHIGRKIESRRGESRREMGEGLGAERWRFEGWRPEVARIGGMAIKETTGLLAGARGAVAGEAAGMDSRE